MIIKHQLRRGTNLSKLMVLGSTTAPHTAWMCNSRSIHLMLMTLTLPSGST